MVIVVFVVSKVSLEHSDVSEDRECRVEGLESEIESKGFRVR